jgi:hypothetical protein
LDDFSFFSSIALAVGAAFNVFFILSGCCISGSLTNHGIYPRNAIGVKALRLKTLYLRGFPTGRLS